ncbi:MAG TPA: UBP-type zinc finger domain-containing protein [Casimicrobiaceae bacterium]|nr:UBP-type zinc finger domain-containing protein [Casimicrobiaceae bacterium]
MHLRTCQTCGGARCCDSSSNRHASKHAGSSGHPVIAAAEKANAGSTATPMTRSPNTERSTSRCRNRTTSRRRSRFTPGRRVERCPSFPRSRPSGVGSCRRSRGR